MRDIFINELYLAAKRNKNIILVVNDLGYSVVEKFAQEFPKQFVNAGVAEQNMIGLAAGLALGGKQVFVYSIGNFPTFRCAEQIRNDIDYHNLPVTIVNVGAGVGYGHLGYTHHTLQDYSLIRNLPNFLIASPTNNVEARLCVKFLINNPQSSYLRLVKKSSYQNKNKLNKIKPGEWIRIIKGDSDKTILMTGGASQIIKKILLKKKFKKYSLCSLPLWGMKYKKKQINNIKKWNKIITLEDHLVDGGFGSWLKESYKGKKTEIEIKGLSSQVIGKVGKEQFLLSKFFNKL
jgi:transketolase